MNIGDLRAEGLDIATPAMRYYDDMTLDKAIQSARERIDEWDYDKDPHGYCHNRPVLIALVLAASWAALGKSDPAAVPRRKEGTDG